ncbi:ribonuclease 3-like protein 3 isoform X2 [Brachypodium distachyon]|uniref:RNase III domain-containing protein n=1 Tax=Brachypodium distachyon TaxID=15368 RepID=A0A0Q3L588_BRADI|nr:ribonuclease 3-like protein 3 isoform X2 [Brachypodium distachyon]KQK18369.1 hypothetical protein BRADI_1g41980v3 [Brachypodium distachyon]|eukprot:XP_014752727.1 ribonuclease 3-like protein 3 isoform X2 [Brachypodium distachyon]
MDTPSPPAADNEMPREEESLEREEAPPWFAPPMGPEDVAAVETLLGYEFGDKSLVGEALTHGSYYYPYPPGDSTYERLEYLGDGVLTCLMSREVFLTYRSLPPGPLTRLRAANVDKEKLARVAVEHGIHRFLRHKAPQLDGQIDDFIKELCKYKYHSNGLLDAPKVLSDIVESLIGAIYLDSNFNQEVVWRVFRNLADPLISLETLGKHPVSELLEFCQKTRRGLQFVKDGWDKHLKVDVLVDGCGRQEVFLRSIGEGGGEVLRIAAVISSFYCSYTDLFLFSALHGTLLFALVGDSRNAFLYAACI